MNHGAPYEQYHNDIGNRTDIWFFAYLQEQHQMKDYNGHQPKFIVRNNTSRRICKELENLAYFIPPEDFFRTKELLYGQPKNQTNSLNNPTTGFVCVQWVVEKINNYKSLDITGFDFFKVPLNYYELIYL